MLVWQPFFSFLFFSRWPTFLINPKSKMCSDSPGKKFLKAQCVYWDKHMVPWPRDLFKTTTHFLRTFSSAVCPDESLFILHNKLGAWKDLPLVIQAVSVNKRDFFLRSVAQHFLYAVEEIHHNEICPPLRLYKKSDSCSWFPENNLTDLFPSCISMRARLVLRSENILATTEPFL